jgi:predicted nucleic acid-binding protein
MTVPPPGLLVDSSVVVKWELPAEPHAAEAVELFLDWRNGAIQVWVPDQLLAEAVSALLGSVRKHPPRLTPAEARRAIQSLLSLPFSVLRTRGKRTLTRAFEIALQYNQKVYDCV